MPCKTCKYWTPPPRISKGRGYCRRVDKRSEAAFTCNGFRPRPLTDAQKLNALRARLRDAERSMREMAAALVAAEGGNA